jgi:hypothetical protein
VEWIWWYRTYEEAAKEDVMDESSLPAFEIQQIRLLQNFFLAMLPQPGYGFVWAYRDIDQDDSESVNVSNRTVFKNRRLHPNPVPARS